MTNAILCQHHIYIFTLHNNRNTIWALIEHTTWHIKTIKETNPLAIKQLITEGILLRNFPGLSRQHSCAGIWRKAIERSSAFCNEVLQGIQASHSFLGSLTSLTPCLLSICILRVSKSDASIISKCLSLRGLRNLSKFLSPLKDVIRSEFYGKTSEATYCCWRLRHLEWSHNTKAYVMLQHHAKIQRLLPPFQCSCVQ